MAKLPLVECRICHVRDIDRNADPNGETWIMPSRNYFYHRDCYKNWKEAEHVDDEDYVELIYDYIARDLRVKYDYHVCEAQRKKFIKDNKMTNKGILFALKYFYEVKHGDWSKGHGSIGILPFIYSESCAYWAAQERKNKGIIERIEQQMREASQQDKQVIVKKEIKPRKFVVDFSVLDDLEEDE